jgi:hypothetical protein
MPQTFVHGTPSVAANLIAGPKVPTRKNIQRSHVCFSRLCMPSLVSPSSPVSPPSSFLLESLYRSRTTISNALPGQVRNRDWQDYDADHKRRGVKRAENRRAAQVSDSTRPEGWVMIFVARGIRVQKAVCHDTGTRLRIVISAGGR